MVEGPCHEVGMVWDLCPHGLDTSMTLGLLYTRRVLSTRELGGHLIAYLLNLVQLHAVDSRLCLDIPS